jgi:UDP-N-acetylglucosamine 2-epimerase
MKKWPVKKRMVLITVHRRENFGEPFKRICDAIDLLSRRFPEIVFVYPVHPNPNILNMARARLGQLTNVVLTEPVEYDEMVYIMMRSALILTDSGGLQEEAPTLGRPVIVLRDVTERPEGIKAGAALLAGTNTERIVKLTTRLLTDKKRYAQMAKARNPYGDGKSARRIAKAIVAALA